jgi:anti-sigma B factor antagonist
MNLQLKERWIWDVLVVQCVGRIVAGPEAEHLQQEVRKNFPHLPHVVLQMAEVEFIDSSGMGTIVRLMSAARAAGGDVKICTLPVMVRKALVMTNLHKVFEIFETEDEALLAALRTRQPEAELPGAQARAVILCVDDSPDLLAYLAELLRKAGHRAITAGNLADAQVLMKAQKPNLILANARMSANGRLASDIFAGCCPDVTLLDLGEGFSRDDAGEAGANLLARVRTLL